VKAGTRDRLITIERAVTTTDAYGQEIETWATAFQEWARVFYSRGNERREAAADRLEMPCTFAVLSNGNSRTINGRDRIVYDGKVWNIEHIAPVTRGEIELTAVSQEQTHG
jgi:SPP1 family predicted phage head-tail adaptor